MGRKINNILVDVYEIAFSYSKLNPLKTAVNMIKQYYTLKDNNCTIIVKVNK